MYDDEINLICFRTDEEQRSAEEQPAADAEQTKVGVRAGGLHDAVDGSRIEAAFATHADQVGNQQA